MASPKATLLNRIGAYTTRRIRGRARGLAAFFGPDTAGRTRIVHKRYELRRRHDGGGRVACGSLLRSRAGSPGYTVRPRSATRSAGRDRFTTRGNVSRGRVVAISELARATGAGRAWHLPNSHRCPGVGGNQLPAQGERPQGVTDAPLAFAGRGSAAVGTARRVVRSASMILVGAGSSPWLLVTCARRSSLSFHERSDLYLVAFRPYRPADGSYLVVPAPTTARCSPVGIEPAPRRSSSR